MVGLFAALLPNMVRASGRPAQAGPRADRFALPAHFSLSYSHLVARAHQTSTASRVHPSTARDNFRGLLVKDPNTLRLTWPQTLQIQTTTSSNVQWAIQLFSSNNGQVVGDLGALDLYSDQAPWVKFHDVNYVQSNPSAVLEQNAVFSLGTVGNGNGLNPYYFKTGWLASIYSTPSQALARVADARSHFQNTYNLGLTDCSTNHDGSCDIVGFEGGGDVGAPGEFYIYVVFAVDNVTGELIFYASDSDIASDGGAQLFAAAAGAIADQAVSQVVAADSCSTSRIAASDISANACGSNPTPTNTPTEGGTGPPPATNTPVPTATPTPRPTNTSTPVSQPEIKLTGISITTEGKDKKLHTATGLKSNQAGYFLAQLEVANAGSRTPSAQISYVYKGKTIATDQMKQVPATRAARSLVRFRAEQAAQSLTYYDIFGLKKLKKAVKLQATVDVSLGSAHDSGSISFSVKTNCTTTKGKKTCK
jgi:hypothetical protein